MQSNGLSCCGWDEMFDLRFWDGTEQEFIDSILDNTLEFVDSYNGDASCGAVLFTYNGKPSRIGDYGKKFAQLIIKLGLGTIQKLPIFINPNHNSKITSYIWVINKRALRNYVVKHRKARDKEDDNDMIDYY